MSQKNIWFLPPLQKDFSLGIVTCRPVKKITSTKAKICKWTVSQWMLCEWQHKGIPDSIFIHSWTGYIKLTVCCIDAVCSSFITWRQITESVFPAISEEANADRDLWMHPAEGKVLTSVHHNYCTCFIRQGCVKQNFDISLYWNLLDGLPALLSFCSLICQWWHEKPFVCTFYLYHWHVYELCAHCCMYPCIHVATCAR